MLPSRSASDLQFQSISLFKMNHHIARTPKLPLELVCHANRLAEQFETVFHCSLFLLLCSITEMERLSARWTLPMWFGTRAHYVYVTLRGRTHYSRARYMFMWIEYLNNNIVSFGENDRVWNWTQNAIIGTEVTNETEKHSIRLEWWATCSSAVFFVKNASQFFVTKIRQRTVNEWRKGIWSFVEEMKNENELR